MTFRRRPAGTPSHPTVTGIETIDGRMIVHEDDRAIEVPLTHGWSVDDDSSISASATRLDDGTIAVDLVVPRHAAPTGDRTRPGGRYVRRTLAARTALRCRTRHAASSAMRGARVNGSAKLGILLKFEMDRADTAAW